MSVKKTTYARPHNVGAQIQQLVTMGYRRVEAREAADGCFDIEGSDRKGSEVTDRISSDSRLKELMPELKKIRDTALIPAEREALTIIIEGVERG